MRNSLSTQSLFERYAGCGSARGEWLRTARFYLRARLQGQLHRHWFDLIDRPELAGARAIGTGLCERLQRPYITARLTQLQRFNLLRKHFELLSRYPEAVRNAVYAKEGWVVATFSEGGIDHIVRLVHQPGTQREGDLSLVWDCSLGRVAMATFALLNSRHGFRVMVIGGLQGSNAGDAHAMYQVLTHAMHGLRPMSALMHFVQLAAGHLGAGMLLGVEDAAHAVYRPGQRNHVKKALSYDTIWKEHGGQPWKLGLYRLPVEPSVRDLAAIASKKRSMYRKRYALLDRIDAAMADSLTWAAQLPTPRIEQAWTPAFPSRLFHPGGTEVSDAFA